MAIERLKKTIKKPLGAALRRLRRVIQSLEDEPHNGTRDYSQDDFAYPWLNSQFELVLRETGAYKKPSYAWGVVHAAHLASNLGAKAISVLEFGVAGGNGLVALERIGERVERIFGLHIDVHGFDTGRGLPKPEDYRDMPNLYLESAFPMDVEKLRKRLTRARLHLGLVRETALDFIDSRPAPVGFVAIDLDYYSSTMDAFQIFEADRRLLLPRVHCYFDDIMGFTNSEFNGERLAIAEFNRTHEMRKISPIYGLQYFVPSRYAQSEWVGEMYMAHLFDHPCYGRYDGLVRRPFSGGTDLKG